MGPHGKARPSLIVSTNEIWCVNGFEVDAGGKEGAQSCNACSHCLFNERSCARPSSHSTPNQYCRFRMRWANSMPARVTAARSTDLNPSIGAHRLLIAR